MNDPIWDTVGAAAFGVLLVYLGFFLLGEYRQLFSKNIRALLSLEVWSMLLMKAGGPVYIAILLMACDAFLIIQGLWAVVSHL